MSCSKFPRSNVTTARQHRRLHDAVRQLDGRTTAPALELNACLQMHTHGHFSGLVSNRNVRISKGFMSNATPSLCTARYPAQSSTSEHRCTPCRYMCRVLRCTLSVRPAISVSRTMLPRPPSARFHVDSTTSGLSIARKLAEKSLFGVAFAATMSLSSGVICSHPVRVNCEGSNFPELTKV